MALPLYSVVISLQTSRPISASLVLNRMLPSGPALICRVSSIRLPCVYHFFLAIVIISYETTATARWALLFIVRAFFNDTITVAVWTGFHVRPNLADRVNVLDQNIVVRPSGSFLARGRSTPRCGSIWCSRHHRMQPRRHGRRRTRRVRVFTSVSSLIAIADLPNSK